MHRVSGTRKRSGEGVKVKNAKTDPGKQADLLWLPVPLVFVGAVGAVPAVGAVAVERGDENVESGGCGAGGAGGGESGGKVIGDAR